jgi:hypothetical protein
VAAEPGAPALEQAGFRAVVVWLSELVAEQAGFRAAAVLPGAPVLARAEFLAAAASQDVPAGQVVCGYFEADSA